MKNMRIQVKMNIFKGMAISIKKVMCARKHLTQNSHDRDETEIHNPQHVASFFRGEVRMQKGMRKRKRTFYQLVVLAEAS